MYFFVMNNFEKIIPHVILIFVSIFTFEGFADVKAHGKFETQRCSLICEVSQNFPRICLHFMVEMSEVMRRLDVCLLGF